MSKQGYNRTAKTPDGYLQQPDGRATLYNQTYIGFVRKVEDDIRMGRLKVWIPDLGGDSDNEASWYTVNYCSPFAGATPISKFDNSDKPGNVDNGTKWYESQMAYGFWAVPPDIDNEVIVMFVSGDPNKGIWIGCLYKQYMNHMVPGIPRNNAFDEGEGGELPPVVEYNKKSEVGNDDDPTRPRFDPLHEGLVMQGLYNDHQRGPSSSGARRESPSKVFGMLSPRGNQMYIDDLECNEFIRFRTRSGVQLLIHETDGYIYMNSKRGNSWLQISDDGIDMYSTKGVNIHSTGGYDFHTDKDYNLHIGGNFNVFAQGDYNVSAVGNTNMLTGKDFKQDVGGAMHSTIKQNRSVTVEGSDNTLSNGNMSYKSNQTFTMKSGSLVVVSAPKITQNTEDGADPDIPAPAEGAQPQPAHDKKLQETYPEQKRDTITTRMPTHEPFPDHPTPGMPEPASGSSAEKTAGSGSAPAGSSSSEQPARGAPGPGGSTTDAPSGVGQGQSSTGKVADSTDGEFFNRGQRGPAAASDVAYLKERSVGGAATRGDSLTHLDPKFAGQVTKMLQDAPPEVSSKIKVTSGYRSNATQQRLYNDALKKYGSPEAARKWVAKPGFSQHNWGTAVDFDYVNDDAKAIAWVHKNAPSYGLTFPMSNENWHVEPIGARAAHRGVKAPDQINPVSALDVTANRRSVNGYAPLLDLIGRSEGTDAHGGYNSVLGHGAYSGGSITLVDKTMDQVDVIQQGILNHPNNVYRSSSVGRYSINQTARKLLQAQTSLGGDVLFTPDVQDSFAQALLEQRGFSRYVRGEISAETFQDSLSEEWPTLPRADGSARYSGTATTVSATDVATAIGSLRPSGAVEQPQKTTTAISLIPRVINISMGKILHNGGAGSCVLVDYSGTMLTNCHVIGFDAQVGQQITVEIAGSKIPAKIVKMEPNRDLAQIRLANYQGLEPLPLGGRAQPGEILKSYGFALGATLTAVDALYTGENSKVGKYASPDGDTNGIVVRGLSVLYTLSGNGIMPGMSGGPILNDRGQLVGLNAAIVPGKDEARFIPL